MLIEEVIAGRDIYLLEIESKPKEEASPKEARYRIVRRVKGPDYPIGQLFLKQVADGTELTLSDHPFGIPKKEYDLDGKEFTEFRDLLLARIPGNCRFEKIS